MGGDYAPTAVINGASEALKRYPGIRFILFGDESRILPILNNLPELKQSSTIHHTDHHIANHEKPSVALRKGKGSSMGMAIEAVKNGQASAVVSAGNTGALMAMSKLVFRTLPGIDRPAITSVFPTRTGKCVLLDLGANVDCNSDNLVQFAIMGDAFAKVILGLKSPRVALLNVGAEDTKGSEVVKAAAIDLREGDYPINFCGYVEGDGITEGIADVVVTDGFTGNIALKTAEGTAKICVSYIKEAFNSSLLAKIGGLLAKSAIKSMFKKMDPRMHNGAMFLGLNGISVKSHGGTDALGFSNAIAVAVELASNNINAKIIEELSFYKDLFEDQAAIEEEI
ncbi:MAG: phosphate acyltransferase [Rickettsiaceae bacterium]|jgi:glycerol-3-phosphate acyltransferase PlsX|nr:phosphate acyltransferase [Rickettsiaceae bacterium]